MPATYKKVKVWIPTLVNQKIFLKICKKGTRNIGSYPYIYTLKNFRDKNRFLMTYKHFDFLDNDALTSYCSFSLRQL